MNIIEATTMLEAEDFTGYIECEDYDSKTLKHIISFNKQTKEWTTLISDWLKTISTRAHFYALSEQLRGNKWVYYSKERDNWFTEYEGE